MKRVLGVALLIGIALYAANQPLSVCAETEQIDLKALAKKARPAVMLLVVSDATGKEIATGTGFLVSADGKLITNFHVIEKAASAIAKAENGGKFEVEGVLAADPKNDLVLLKIKGKDLPFLTLGKSDNIEVGTRIAVIGSPLGLEGTLSEGIVSAVRDLVGTRVLQVTAPVSPGSSGSPVLSARGDVIGVVSGILRSGQSLNFAIPAESVSAVVAHPPKSAVVGFAEVAVPDELKLLKDPDLLELVTATSAAEMLKYSRALVARYPEVSTSHYLVGIAYKAAGFTEDAVSAFQMAIKLEPEFKGAWRQLGVMHCLLKNKPGAKESAIKALKQFVLLSPNDVDSWIELGKGYSTFKERGEAVAAFRQAVRLRPDHIEAKRCFGIACYVAGEFHDAISAMRGILVTNPDNPDAWSILANTYIALERKAGTNAESHKWQEASIDALRRYLRLKPQDSLAWSQLSLQLSFHGDEAEAAVARRRSAEIDGSKQGTK